jgi:hypothetical protein
VNNEKRQKSTWRRSHFYESRKRQSDNHCKSGWFIALPNIFIHNNPAKFGGESVKWLEKQIGEFYSLSDQLENGVIGIEFEIV